MDEKIMNAKVKGLWLIVECPKCCRIQVVNKWVMDNSVVNILKTRYMTCEHCDSSYFVELTQADIPIQ